MKISVFLSYPQPYMKNQQTFIDKISEYLSERGFEPRTLGVTDYDVDAPLTAIRRLMLESNGVLTIAFRRAFIESGTSKPNSDLGGKTYSMNQKWLTSPWCHIEAAMAFQIGLPILIFRESGVIDDGILERGVTGTYMPEFDLDQDIEKYFKSISWNQLINKWEGYVRKVVENKGMPPRMY